MRVLLFVFWVRVICFAGLNMLETVEVAHGFMFEFSHSWESLESEDGGRFDTETTRPEENEPREAS